MLSDNAPFAPLLTWCEAALQTHLVVRGEHSHSHGESRVWKLQGEVDNTVFYLKSHRRPHKWEQEAAFYEDFLPLAPPEMQAQTPRLFAAHDEQDEIPRALLFSALPGVPLESIVPLSLDAERKAWECAGRYYAQLHALPLGYGGGECWFGAIQRNRKSRTADPPTFPVGLLVQDLENAMAPLPLSLGGSPLLPNEAALGREAIGLVQTAFDGEPPVLCQRDSSPRNWIADAQTGNWVGVLDFEHTRRDVRIAEIAKWWDGPFLTRPDLKDAFWAGYGPWPDTNERFAAQLRVTRIVQALGQIKWARNHDDGPSEARGHEAADRLLRV